MFGWFYGRTREGRTNSAAVADALARDGEILITVHGTSAGRPDNDGDAWWQRGSTFETRIGAALTEKLGATPQVLPFHWSGANSEHDRMMAGMRLAAVMRRLEKKRRPYHILAHSHGGNVVVEAVSRFTRIGRRKRFLRSVSTFGTPYFVRRLKPMSKAFLTYRALLLIALVAITVIVLYATVASTVQNTPAADAATVSTASNVGYVIGLVIGVAIAAAIGLVPSYILWRSVAPLARQKARFVKAMRKTGLEQRWLALWARRDEAIGLLMRATAFKTEFITARGMARTLTRVAATLAALAITLTPLLMFIFWRDMFTTTTDQAEKRLAETFGIVAGLAIGVFFYALPAFFLLHLLLSFAFRLGPQHASAWFLNRTIVSGIRTGMFGDDSNFALKGVAPTPEKVQVVSRELDSAALGGYADEDALEAAKLIYKELIEIEDGRVAETDPAGIWSRLCNAICHNGYFTDDSAISAVVDHIAAASPRAATPKLPPAAKPKPRVGGNGVAHEEAEPALVPA